MVVLRCSRGRGDGRVRIGNRRSSRTEGRMRPRGSCGGRALNCSEGQELFLRMEWSLIMMIFNCGELQ